MELTMPFSNDRFDEHMKRIISQSGCQTWLDIGAGAGKHGKMIRELLPDAHITGVEVELDYINKYSLKSKYDVLRPINCMALMKEQMRTYDAVILGDVLEHLPKSQGIDMVNFLVYRCKILIAIYPIGRIQNGHKGYVHESHISIWGVSDWDNFDHIMIDDPASHLVMVDGYIEHERIT